MKENLSERISNTESIVTALALAVVGCSDDSGSQQGNENVNNINSNDNPCGEQAPLADLQAGVCAGAQKVCDATST